MDIVGLLMLLAMSYAAGYFTRDYVSRRRREQARRWKDYAEPEAPHPANSNEAIPPSEAVAGQLSDLGRMLDRWEGRARARKLRAAP